MFAKGTITCTPEEFGFSWPLIKVINAEVLYCVIGKGDLAFNRLFKGVSGLFVLFWLYAVLLWTINLCYSPINAWPWICSHDFMQFSDPMWIIVNTTCWFITRLLKVACYENTYFVLLQYQPTICFLYYVVQKFWWKSLCCCILSSRGGLVCSIPVAFPYPLLGQVSCRRSSPPDDKPFVVQGDATVCGIIL